MSVEKGHIHQLKRHKFKTGSSIYFCVGDKCGFKIQPQLALGKMVICWRCNKPFKLNEYSIRLAKPHCNACHKNKEVDNSPEVEVKVNVIDDLRARMGFDKDI